MNYGDKFKEGNAFDTEERVVVELPELYCGEDKGAPRGRRIILLSVAAVLTAVVCIGILLFSKRDAEPVDIPLPSETEGEWRGAFADKSIYEAAVECSVGVRKGAFGQSRCWSGVVISGDGLILTSSRFLETAESGKLYVMLGDGREYAVESILRVGELAALKISAEDLECAEILSNRPFAGQEVIAVSEGQYVISAEIAGRDQDGVRLNAMLSAESEGSPVFDREGHLSGIAVDADGTPRLIFVSDIDGLLDRIKK